MRGDVPVNIPKSHRFLVPDQGNPRYWLVFEGHQLPLTVNPGAFLDRDNTFRFSTTEPEQLRAFIEANCLNPSIPGLAHITYNYEATGQGERLFPPSRVLHSVSLYEEREILPGIFYAINQDGKADIYDTKYFHGGTYDVSGKYAIHIFKNKCFPERLYRKNGYKTLEGANKALLFHANRLFNPVHTAPEIARGESEELAIVQPAIKDESYSMPE